MGAVEKEELDQHHLPPVPGSYSHLGGGLEEGWRWRNGGGGVEVRGHKQDHQRVMVDPMLLIVYIALICLDCPDLFRLP